MLVVYMEVEVSQFQLEKFSKLCRLVLCSSNACLVIALLLQKFNILVVFGCNSCLLRKRSLSGLPGAIGRLKIACCMINFLIN